MEEGSSRGRAHTPRPPPHAPAAPDASLQQQPGPDGTVMVLCL